MKIICKAAAGQWIKATTAYEKIMATAVTGAMRDVAKEGRDKGRQAIASAGFSTRFANSLVSKNFPSSGVSMNPTAYIHSTINYADVFEHGKTISGNPSIWLPLPNVPPDLGAPAHDAQTIRA